MLKIIVKRDGREEPLMPHKINSWSIWASEQLGDRVDWSAVVMEAMQHFKEKATSQDLQKQLIKACVRRKSWPYSLMAGRLYAAMTRKEIYNDITPPSIYEVQYELARVGLMRELDYSKQEYDEIEKFIDHSRDFEYAYPQILQLRKKYALRNRVTKAEFESPQFVYMRMAMALAEDEPKESRLEHIVNWYNHFSFNRINAPSPNYVNLGTKLNGYASCCLYKSGDNIHSLAIGDHIAYEMTGMSAGIGGMISTRTIGDPVRGGAIAHQGKLSYYRSLAYATRANQQAGRGGACTSYYSAFDPENTTIALLQNPMSTEDKRIRELHFGVMFNRLFTKKVAKKEKVFRFTEYTAPDLWKALFSGNQDRFEELYNKYDKDPEFKKDYIDAREFAVLARQQAYECGTHYELFIDEMNRHTPFKTEENPIHSSNLCVAPHTEILTKDGFKAIGTLKDQEVEVWNGEEWSLVTIRQTGTAKSLLRVHMKSNKYLDCTPEHRWYFKDSENFVETKDILSARETIDWKYIPEARLYHGDNEAPEYISDTVLRVEKLPDLYDTYCCTEPKKHTVIFNGIITGQCAEIALPTEAYYDMRDLYSGEDHGRGEIAICALGGIPVTNIHSDSQYKSAAYYTLKMIDKCIDMSDYPFPHVALTAKSRRSAGVGMLGVATDLARRGLNYTTQAGRDHIHYLAERHYYYLVEASLRLAQEKGNAPWIDKTKWPEGWLPIDTYKKTVDQLVEPIYRYDWEDLRKRVIVQGGIRNSVLVAEMPTESSSKSSGVPNSIYPIRELAMKKSDNSNIVDWVATDSDLLKDKYQLAWDIPTMDMIKVYAIFQKFTDQGISADFWKDRVTDPVIHTDEIVEEHIAMCKYGMKSRYYQNSLTADKSVAEADQTSNALMQTQKETVGEPEITLPIQMSNISYTTLDTREIERKTSIVVESKEYPTAALVSTNEPVTDDDLFDLAGSDRGCGSGSCTL